MDSSRKISHALFLMFLVAVPFYAICQETSPALNVETIVRSLDFADQLPDEVKWLPKSDRFSYIQHDSITGDSVLRIQNAATLQQSEILTLSDALYVTPHKDSIQLSLSHYTWLPDENGIVLRSYGDLWYYNLPKKEMSRLTSTWEEETQVTISPNSEYVGFVRDNDLYVIRLKNGKEYRITTTGNQGLLNGKLDWVYQEELVGRGFYRAYWWSPDSKYLAYLQFDETPVPEYPIVDWIPYHPDLEMMHYPKAGDSNPIVKLGVARVQNKPATIWMDTGENTDMYIPRVYWVPGERQLAFMRLDRAQEHLDFLIANTRNGNSKIVLQEEDPHWINITGDVQFLKRRNQFIWESERTGYRHLYLYNTDGTLQHQLTAGDWMVTDLTGVNEKDGWIYFVATKDGIRQRQIYRVNMDSVRIEKVSDNVGTHDPKLAASGDYYLDWYSDLTTPKQINLHLSNGSQIKHVAVPDTSVLAEYNLPKPELFTFDGTNGITYEASILKPLQFDPGERYPVIVYVYGGPHDQEVRRKFGGRRQFFHQMMAQRGYIIFTMDNRGSWGRGHQWETAIDQNLGATELSDQLWGVKYLKALPYVDSTRIGIWGWSYGGYMTLFALTHTDAFSTGVSVGPVADWRDYDTIYTERYMGLPSENSDGYYRSAPTNFAKNLHGRLLLMHGTSDDNVHLQNSIQMVDKLISAEKPFDLMVYPEKKHGISSDNDQIFLYKKMARHFDEYLKGKEK